ncbi:MAG: hypothetical protein IT353_08730 [Gemmatimonadaceae bacterium]|nr:hypothetical protein [Gemmatimonadaceae bacterium]
MSRVIAVACLSTACATAPITYASRAADAEAAARDAVRRESQLNVASIPQNTLSVSPLTVLSTDTSYASLGYGFASLLVNDLSQSAQLALVERLRLEAVLRELDLAKRGRIDTLTAPRLGKLIGARQAVVGSLDLRTRGNVRVQSYVANTTTGKVGSSLTGSSTLNQIFDAEKSLVFRLFDVLGVKLTPEERRTIEAHATRSLVAFLAFSRGSRAEAFGDFPAALGHYSEAVRLDPTFTVAQARRAALETPVRAVAGPVVGLSRVIGVSTDLINRPSAGTVGTAADAPSSAGRQLVTFTVIVRTP